jgi:hypothetical protein
MRVLFSLAMLVAFAFVPSLAHAQAGPTMAAAQAGIPSRVAADEMTQHEAAEAAAHGGLGTGGALMIVGGAAFITGLIIGGGAGTALAVGGVLVAAYGLYLFLK